MKFDLAFFESLPKAELHCHLDGSLRVKTILDLAKKNDVKLPHDSEKALTDYLQVGDDCQSLEDYLKAFNVTNKVLQTEAALERCAYELIEDASKENVWHLEIRFSPVLHTIEGLSLRQVIEAVIKGKEKAEADFFITVGIIVCGIRSMTPEVSFQLAELAVDYKDKGVVAYDLAGPEENYPAKDHKEAFYHIINNNINTTVHAGEAYGAESIHQAIHFTRANRIGHGTRLFEDQDLLEYVLNHRITLEMCVNCNVQTQCVASLEDHPVKSYLDKGLRVTLNTDNRLISNTSLSKEFLTVHETFGLNKSEIHTLINNSFKAAFIGYKKRKVLLAKVAARLAELGL